MKKLFWLVLLFAAFPAAAQESEWAKADYVQARLVSGSTAFEDDFRAGLEIKLGEGWHAFWRTAGEGGLPPRLDWSGSDNLVKIDVSWPVPERFDTAGLYSFGYKDSVLLPLSVDVLDDAKPVTLNLKAEIMVCGDICVPQKLSLSLTVPPGIPEKTAHTEPVAGALAKVPGAALKPQLTIESVVIGPEAVVVTAYSSSGFDQADLFIEAGEYLHITARPEITLDKNDRRKAMIRVAAPEGTVNLARALAEKTVILTLTNGKDAVEKTVSF